MGVIKNNPRSILLAFSGIIVVGFGAFVFAKDLVSNERRAEEIRRIKRERRMLAYRDYKALEEDDDAKKGQGE
ncbi:hypothetical protein H4R20_000169 [Coemansia guatemalensis]|uniref:Uncharacterized protein n=1 Tax=Coemansia guatemalensis TaxID=2761395 RepID=A0A9W8HZP3_9FUNG|nr:hypothetical protein H4R20_000169 [Coemansia guatemalensis]